VLKPYPMIVIEASKSKPSSRHDVSFIIDEKKVTDTADGQVICFARKEGDLNVNKATDYQRSVADTLKNLKNHLLLPLIEKVSFSPKGITITKSRHMSWKAVRPYLYTALDQLFNSKQEEA